MSVQRVAELTAFAVAQDGETISLEFTEESGQPGTLVIRNEHLKEMMLTLPEIARQSLARKYHDASLRVVYPVAAWTLEVGSGDNLVLVFRSPDGFEIAFALCRDMIGDIAALADRANPIRPLAN